MSNYLRQNVGTLYTPQSEPVPGSSQQANDAGGYAWKVDRWQQLDRFLVLGSEGGTYYVSERELTTRAIAGVLGCWKADWARTARRIAEISSAGRAPKQDPALYALAAGFKIDPALPVAERDARAAALLEAFRVTVRTGTHLLHFVAFCEQFRGWGKFLQRAVTSWLAERSPSDLAYQAIKYGSRDGWALRDLLRLAKPKAGGSTQEILRWIAKGWPEVGVEPHPDEALRQIWATETLKRYPWGEEAGSAKAVIGAIHLIVDYRLPREVVPSQLLNEPRIWEALLADMPLGAMVRTLGKMTSVGLLGRGSQGTRAVVERLHDRERIRRARLHPLALLMALKVYASGHGDKGALRWAPVQPIAEALDEAFYLAFDAVEPVGRPLYVAVDVSGSMDGGTVAGTGLTPRQAAAALALVWARTEPQVTLRAFSHRLVDLPIRPSDRLDHVIGTMEAIPMGGTDCALPMLDAKQRGPDVDGFLVLTDNETWAGSIHPSQALQRYRAKSGRRARLAVLGMTAGSFSIADPDDPGMLDVVGLDAAVPALVGDFLRG